MLLSPVAPEMLRSDPEFPALLFLSSVVSASSFVNPSSIFTIHEHLEYLITIQGYSHSDR